MKTIKLTLLGIMVMLTASLRAQIQQRNWFVFQPSSLSKNIMFSNSPSFGPNLFQPIINGTPLTNYVGSNAAFDDNGDLIFYVVTTNSNAYIFNHSNQLIYQKTFGIDEYAPREIPIIPYKCNTAFDIWINSIVIKYDIAESNSPLEYQISNTNSTAIVTFGNNLLNSGTQIGNVKYHTSIAVAKTGSNDIYDLYTFAQNNPGGQGNRALLHCRINPNSYQALSGNPITPVMLNYYPISSMSFLAFQSNVEVSPDRSLLAFADDDKIYIYNLNTTTGQIGTLNTQINYLNGQNQDYKIAGIEFSADNTMLLFSRFHIVSNQSQPTNAVGVLNIQTQTLSYISNTEAFAHSEIELARDGNLYLTSSSGLYRFDFATATFILELNNFQNPLNNGVNYTSSGLNYNYSIRNLPDQIDGINNSIGKIIHKNFETLTASSWTPSSNPFCSNCTKVYIMGDMNIKHNTDVNGIDFEFMNEMPAGSNQVIRTKITVDPQTRFRLQDSKLKSNDCSGMWEGIVGFDAQIELYSGGFPNGNINEQTSIQDAYQAIRLSGSNARLAIYPTTSFNRNWIHVNLNNFVINNTSVNMYIQGAEFLHTIQLKDQGVTPDGFGLRSITLSNSSPSVNSHLLRILNCTFTGGQTAIQSNSTKLECINNTFSQIKEQAIRITGVHASPAMITLNLIDNAFLDNRQHVFALLGTNIFAVKNSFTNSSVTGIEWRHNRGSKFILGSANDPTQANTFTINKQQAISCSFNTHANTEIKINRNNFIGEANSGAIYISEATNSAATINGSYKRLEITHNNMSFGRWGIRLDNVLGSQVRTPIYDASQNLPLLPTLDNQTARILNNNISYNTSRFSWTTQLTLATEGLMGNNAQGITLIENAVQPIDYPNNTAAFRTTRNAAMRFTHGRRNMIYKNILNGGEGIRADFDAMDANIFCNTLDHYVNGFNFNSSRLRNRSLTQKQDRTHGWSDLPRHNNFSNIGGGKVDINLENTSIAGMRWWFGPISPFVRVAPSQIPVKHSLIGWIREGASSVSNTCMRFSGGGGDGDIYTDTSNQSGFVDYYNNNLSDYYNNWYGSYMQHIESIHTGETLPIQNSFMQAMAQTEHFIALDNLEDAFNSLQLAQPTNEYEINYKNTIATWLAANFPSIRDYSQSELNSLFNVSTQSSLVVGPAATMARIYLKMALDTTIHEPEPEEQFGIGGWLQAEQCAPFYFANAQIGLVGDNIQIGIAAIADSTGRFYIEPEILAQIDANATFDIVIHTTSGDIYAMNKTQTVESWVQEPEVHLYKNCASAAMVGLSKDITTMEQIKAYPIPANDILNIIGLDNTNSYIITLTDMSGKEITSQEIAGKSKLEQNISGLQQGIYLLHVINAAGTNKTIKFVK